MEVKEENQIDYSKFQKRSQLLARAREKLGQRKARNCSSRREIHAEPLPGASMTQSAPYGNQPASFGKSMRPPSGRPPKKSLNSDLLSDPLSGGWLGKTGGTMYSSGA